MAQTQNIVELAQKLIAIKPQVEARIEEINEKAAAAIKDAQDKGAAEKARLLNVINSDPDLKAQYDAFKALFPAEVTEQVKPSGKTFTLLRNGTPVAINGVVKTWTKCKATIGAELKPFLGTDLSACSVRGDDGTIYNAGTMRYRAANSTE